MFTGIVQGMGRIKQVHEGHDQRSFIITLPEALSQAVEIGASVAVNGTCLTVTGQQGCDLNFDVIGQTLSLTNLGLQQQGSLVNIERSLKMGDELGGHIISGHVTIAIKVTAVEHQDDNTSIWFALPQDHQKHVLPQGFIGLNGCSLTVANVEDTRFSVCLIPETLRMTTFGNSQVGDMVNMEIDHQTQTIVATVERVLQAQKNNN
ncbi:MAG: riboflavin synthase subunit alpha [Gammaproteobacteria bacterium]|jgi:riboflavin synthase|nr:riboflavin synthase subunit alpha [Gammaproteobacteria bacterium]